MDELALYPVKNYLLKIYRILFNHIWLSKNINYEHKKRHRNRYHNATEIIMNI